MHDFRSWLWRVPIYAYLAVHSLLVLYPMFIMITSSFKPTMELFRRPFALPSSFYLGGYEKVWSQARFDVFLWNSVAVTAASLLILLTVRARA